MRNNEYFCFLVDLVWDEPTDILVQEEDERHELRLLGQLHSMEFWSVTPNDDNRGMDGLELRDEFLNEGGGQLVLPFSQCTMLEMLIGLSHRLEFETIQSKWEKSYVEWFWILIDNLGLDYRSNEDLSRAEYHHKIEKTVVKLLERRYGADGEGGLFPLKHPKHDQRGIEIWYQMSEYILENYPI
jgi:hypothetical protein